MINKFNRINKYLGTMLILLTTYSKEGYSYNIPKYLEEYSNYFNNIKNNDSESISTTESDNNITFKIKPTVLFPIDKEKSKILKLDEINLDPPDRFIKKGIIEKINE
ncbi:MAG: hypothetical protein QXW97_02970 [Candidatus Pacearchaeota archaeon]